MRQIRKSSSRRERAAGVRAIGTLAVILGGRQVYLRAQQAQTGEPWFTKAGVEHWHGASPNEDMLQLTIYEGTVNWLGPVSYKEHLAAPATK